MAQWENKKETELKVPETLTLCVNNCGRPANPTTKNMCQSCFNASLSINPTLSSRSTARSEPIRSPPSSAGTAEKAVATAATEEPCRTVNRCAGCRRKVGLTGFRCRCGELFCAEHRYSDRHACGFDYRKAAREAIARENPVCKAAKIVRI